MNKVYVVIYALVMLVAVILGWTAWQDARQVTVLVEWTTASELDTAGFNLHRSENPDGPFTQINELLIPASSDPLVGGSYSFEDQHVTPGAWYHYQLEEVELDGGTSYFGPISVQAEGSTGIGYYLSLAFIAVGIIYGLVYLARRVRHPATAVKSSSMNSEP